MNATIARRRIALAHKAMRFLLAQARAARRVSLALAIAFAASHQPLAFLDTLECSGQCYDEFSIDTAIDWDNI